MATTRGGKQKSSSSIKTINGMTARHASKVKAFKAKAGRYPVGSDRKPVCNNDNCSCGLS